jgi:hypothetical protein
VLGAGGAELAESQASRQDADRFRGSGDEHETDRAERDYRQALKEIEGLTNTKRNTPEGDLLDALVTLVEAWEAKHHPLNLGNSR